MPTDNGVILQYFHWYTLADGTLWRELAARAGDLAKQGFTAIWIPPCSKGSGGGIDVGYGQYDLFDLGEFNQKGSVRTKYGTKDELLDAIQAVHQAGMQVYADIVFNH
jgi:alpha-amylase